MADEFRADWGAHASRELRMVLADVFETLRDEADPSEVPRAEDRVREILQDAEDPVADLLLRFLAFSGFDVAFLHLACAGVLPEAPAHWARVGRSRTPWPLWLNKEEEE